MLERPPLRDDQIAACLRRTYGLAVTEIEFIPCGYDHQAGVFRVWVDGQSYFLKAKSDAAAQLSVRLPRYLKERGIEQVVAPLPTITGEP